jgi:post-segregation antitoxin (ccd killing protein)
MKTKLTVTIDEQLLPKAKQYARSRGVSLSRLIENALREMGAGEAGSFSLAGRDDERYRALTKKHL